MGEAIVIKLADDIANRLAKKCIRELKKLTCTMSGDDSGLKTVWEEICVQVEDEQSQSFYWSAYVETACNHIRLLVEGLKAHELDALWLLAQAKGALQIDEDWDDETGECIEVIPPMEKGEIVGFIFNYYVCEKAQSSSNKRVRKYLDRIYRARYADDRCN